VLFDQSVPLWNGGGDEGFAVDDVTGDFEFDGGCEVERAEGGVVDLRGAGDGLGRRRWANMIFLDFTPCGASSLSDARIENLDCILPY